VMAFLPVIRLMSGSFVIVEIEQQMPLLRGSGANRAASGLARLMHRAVFGALLRELILTIRVLFI